MKTPEMWRDELNAKNEVQLTNVIFIYIDEIAAIQHDARQQAFKEAAALCSEQSNMLDGKITQGVDLKTMVTARAIFNKLAEWMLALSSKGYDVIYQESTGQPVNITVFRELTPVEQAEVGKIAEKMKE